MELMVMTWPPNFPDFNHMLVQSVDVPPRNLQDLEYLPLMSWSQMPQHIFRGYVKPILCWDLCIYKINKICRAKYVI